MAKLDTLSVIKVFPRNRGEAYKVLHGPCKAQGYNCGAVTVMGVLVLC